MTVLAIVLEPPWQVWTPIGDAECHVLLDHGLDHPARYHCSIKATGEFWTFTQPEIRRNTNITEGRVAVTPFADGVMRRFEPMRRIAEGME